MNQERDVRFDTSDAKLLQAPFHASGRFSQRSAAGGDLDQHGVIKWVDYSARIGAASIQPNPHPASAAVVDDAAVVWAELIGGILGGHAALHGKTIGGDLRLIGQAHVRVAQTVPHRDQDLSPH